MKKNMASEQGIIWLRSMSKDVDIFNSVNAENCLALIEDLRRQLRDLGSKYNALRKDNQRAWNIINEARIKALDQNDILPFEPDEEEW